MGARINSDKNDDFLSYLINNFNNNREGIIVSTILIGVEEGKKSEKNIYKKTTKKFNILQKSYLQLSKFYIQYKLVCGEKNY